MKYLKIKLLQNGKNTPIIYPVNYQSEIGDFAVDHLYYEEKSVSWLLLLISDKDFRSSMIRDYVTEISETEAKTISESTEQRTERITDEAKVRRIELKVARNLSLTKEEEDALDPKHPTLGFGYNKILADRIDDKKIKET